MANVDVRDSVLVIGAGGRTGAHVVRYLCAAAVPVIACVRRADRLAHDPRLASAEIAVANLEQPHTVAPLIDRAAQIIYVAGSQRRSLSPGAWQLEVDSLASCIEFAWRSGFGGRLIYVGHSAAERRGSAAWAETRWRELKLAAEQAIVASGLNYFILRTGHVMDAVSEEPRVRVSQPSGAVPDAELPCNALAFLLTGVALAGAAHRSSATVQLDKDGLKLQAAVAAFTRLRSDTAGAKGLEVDRPRVSMSRG